MKGLFLLSALVFALTGLQANAYWECRYSCGSKGQEVKLGHGDSQSQACQEAQSQTCTEYEGGNPKYYQGSNWVDEGGGWDHGGGNGGGYSQWQCTYSCGSKGQEQKVGYGWSQEQASWEAQQQTCTQYEGGHPKYFQGCSRN